MPNSLTTSFFLNAKQQYQQATTVSDQKTAIAAWQTALNQLQQIPGQTLAGETIQNQLVQQGKSKK